MGKNKRKPRESSVEDKDFLKPIDITQFGTDNDPCFGKHYNLSTDECKRCGDSALCSIIFSRGDLKNKRKSLEDKNRFKDVELDTDEASLDNWLKQKAKEKLKPFKVVKLAKVAFPKEDRKLIKKKYKKHYNG